MYKVMLADTDGENLRNFKNYIASSHPDFTVTRAVSVYREDLEKVIRKNNIQLIIADVRFFGSNSYYTIKELSREFPDMKFVLYGTINDVEYMKKSMDFGTVDYMLKPVKPSDLARCLRAADRHFEFMKQRERDSQKLLTRYKDNFSVFEQQFLQNLVGGVLTSDKEIRESFRYFGISLPGKYVVIQMKINHFREVVKQITEEEKHLLIYGLLNTINMSFDGLKCKCLMNAFNAITIILSGVEEIEDLYALCEKMKNHVLNKNNVDVTIGIGRVYAKPSEIHISYNEAVHALNHRFYMGYSTIIPIVFVEPENNVTYRYPIKKENNLVRAAVMGEFDYCTQLLRSIVASLRESAPLPEGLLPQIIVDILISISRYAQEQRLMPDEDLSVFFSTAEAMKIETVDEGYAYLYSSLQKFCDHVNKRRYRADRALVKKAKEYLQSKYYEAISLNKAAMKVSTTPEYLNKLFQDYEGKSYFEYAVRLRLDIAKKFLRETDLDDEIIAVNIGYDDGKYFNGVFKQYENMSTDEYRASVNNKK